MGKSHLLSNKNVGHSNTPAWALLFIVAQRNQSSMGSPVPGLAAPISPLDWQNLGTRFCLDSETVCKSEQRNCQKTKQIKNWLVLSEDWSKSASFYGRFKWQSTSILHWKEQNILPENFWLTLLLSRGELSKLIVFDRWGLSSSWYRR